MSAPETIRKSCAEIREQARRMSEQQRMLAKDVVQARRSGYEDGYVDGFKAGASWAERKMRDVRAGR